MKTKIILVTSVFFAALILISSGLLQVKEGPHKGTVKQAGGYYIEVKNNYPFFNAYLLSNKLESISNVGISCEVRFLFVDSTISITALKPFGKDGFSIELPFLDYYSCRIYFNVFGRSISAHFENENIIVNKNK